MNTLPPAVREALGHYVYLYIDPRTDEIFYVGKGYNNRVFHFGRDYVGSAVATRIEEIRNDNREPKIDILAHGFAKKETALRVEAAAIDLVGRDKLLNKTNGFESREFGRYPLDELVAVYSQNPIKIRDADAVLLIRVNQLYYAGMPAQELYEITRGVWKASRQRAECAQYAFAVFNNVVREVYEISGWFEAGQTAYFYQKPEEVKIDGRIEFVGRIAPEEVQKRYLFKSVSEYFARGAANPIQYVNC